MIAPLPRNTDRACTNHHESTMPPQYVDLLPKLLCVRLRMRLARGDVPAVVAAQQWRASIKARLNEVSPTVLRNLVDPEHAPEAQEQLSPHQTSATSTGSNSSTPGFALFAQPASLHDGANQLLYLTCIGNAAKHWPLILQAILLTQANGLGAQSMKFHILDIERYSAQPGWHAMPFATRGDATDLGYGDWLPAELHRSPTVQCSVHESALFTVQFLSRTVLLRHGKERLGVEQWSDIGDALLARAQRLRSAWNPDVSRINEQRWCETCTILRDLGAEIQLVESTLRPDNGELSSGRQRTRYASSGLVGATLWEAPPSAFAAWLPLLRFGELVQLGQQTTVGMGRFRVAG